MTAQLSTEQIMQALATALAPALKHTTPSGTPSTPYVHGPGGLFGVMGLEREIIHTRLQPVGLAGRLPVRANMDQTPLFPYISGFRDVTGTVADGVCDDPQTAGPMKTCLQTAPFGRYSFMTRELEINRVGQRINRGEFMDLTLVNDPLARSMGRAIMPNVPGEQQALAGAEMLQRFIEVGIAFQNQLAPQLYVGTTTNNSGGGGYEEFNGLDLLIGTGKVDAQNLVACPSLDSIVWDYNLTQIDDANASPDIVTLLTNIVRRIMHIATRTGLQPLELAFSMRQDLFWELTDIWACAYWTYRCDVSGTGERLNLDAQEVARFRDDMRNGNYLLIDGRRFPVVIDDAIAELSSDDDGDIPVGCFASDIYIVPLRARGMDVLYWEHFDYRQGPMQAVVDGRLTQYFWTDGGIFLWHAKPPNNWCVQHLAKTEPRVILRTPHLAARILDVMYCPLQHSRDTFPSQDYWIDGGNVDRPELTFYHESNIPD
jgi:hypothetical protein